MSEAQKLADELNNLGAEPFVNKGKTTLRDKDCNDLDVEGEGYVDSHPEGEDRGGYVPYWNRNGIEVYWDENGEFWAMP